MRTTRCSSAVRYYVLYLTAQIEAVSGLERGLYKTAKEKVISANANISSKDYEKSSHTAKLMPSRKVLESPVLLAWGNVKINVVP